jgi:dimethylhistidine N-methyltransferase
MNVRAQAALRVPRPFEPPNAFAADVIAGLTAHPKRLPPKYFYDHDGSALFERITELPEYYPTRSELRILSDNAGEIARFFPADCVMIEFGSGSTRKMRILLDAAPAIAGYVPVDISATFLQQQAAELRRDYPRLTVHPVADDFTKAFAVPDELAQLPRVGFFPGSTIGNFEPHDAAKFLRHVGNVLGEGATLIIGVDLEKDAETLNAAYNDGAGVTAQFNLNLLARINRELGADFDLSRFEHHAFYNRERHRIEMHLASCKRQKVHICGMTIDFRAGETIHTESSYKYTIDSFGALARGTGWKPRQVWTDGLFSVHALSFTDEPPRRRE